MTLEEVGTRIKLVSTNDPYTKLKPGDEGTVKGSTERELWVDWDDGSKLSLLPGEDMWEVVRMP